jgi:Fungal Zn(2)-Cys(6) binuclear cluster domain
MSKRSWQEANLPSPYPLPGHARSGSSTSPHSYYSPALSTSPKKIRPSEDTASTAKAPPPSKRAESSSNGVGVDTSKIPGISRKVKACAACRKQKIKCIMQGDPPCQRCKERGLSCKLNKSLQTLMSEDSKWKSSVTKDVTALYSSVEQMLQLLNLPALPQLQTSTQDPAIFFDQDDGGNEEEEDQSLDNSPKVTPITDNLSHVPIESLYQITGMRSLRAAEGVSEDQSRICKQLRDTDFISRGVIKLEDAEPLASYYLNKLDPYIWHLCPDYKDLDSFRNRSPTLTAAVLTVAALHDTARCHLYSTCAKEYRRLVANAMFERKIDMEYLRALVIGSYWLSDISWTLSGYAIRRASEFHLKQCYMYIADSVRSPEKVDAAKLHESMDGIRVLYLLYICDHHLSVLYGRSSIMRDNEIYITGWEAYLGCSLATDADRRIAGQICLMYLINQIRESLGPEDTTTVLPSSALSKIAGFERDLDDWIARFSRHSKCA